MLALAASRGCGMGSERSAEQERKHFLTPFLIDAGTHFLVSRLNGRQLRLQTLHDMTALICRIAGPVAEGIGHPRPNAFLSEGIHLLFWSGRRARPRSVLCVR